MPNQIKIRPLKDKLRQFFSPIVYECSVFRNNGKPIGGFADENEIADAFSPTHSYVVGEPCIYENVVRICTTPHNGNWNASHFRSVSVMGYAQEIVKNLGMPPEYDPDYEYLLGDLCTHDGLWYRSLWGYSGGGAGAWDETKWERVNSLDEIESLNQNLAELSSNKVLYNGYISTGSDVAISELSSSRLLILDLNYNPQTSAGRSRVIIPRVSNASYYTINVGGVTGYIRVETSGNTLSFLSCSISSYYITSVIKVL